jgi:hypothetical protein
MTTAPSLVSAASPAAKRRQADLVFYGSLAYTSALTLFWVFVLATGRGGGAFFSQWQLTLVSVRNVAVGFTIFNLVWGLIWLGIKNVLLAKFVGFTKEERRQAFSSRFHEPFDLAGLLSRYSERRIRIADMIGRRGRFIILQLAGFTYLYHSIATQPTAKFLHVFLSDNLLDAVFLSWGALAFYYVDGFLGRLYYGPQTRVMDGSLGRANCLLIVTLWSAFKFILVPIGTQLGTLFPAQSFAVLFVLIWGCYTAADATSEIVGALFGRQKIRVWGMGDVNRKSIEGTLGGFVAALAVALWAVLGHGYGGPWIGLAVAVAVASTLVELYSPRGTDDFTMATTNALIVWAFGAFVLN